MSTVTCSDGPNGLMKKYPTQGALPGFPNIGGVPGVGWNSPSVRHPPAAFPFRSPCPDHPNTPILPPSPPDLSPSSPARREEKKQKVNTLKCGSCWKLTYEGNSVNIIAVDSGIGGFNLAFAAMDELTGGNAEFLGRVEAEAVEVDRSVCGM